MSDTLTALQRKLITANHILHHHGVVDAYGHISVRHPEEPDKYIMCGWFAPALVTSPADLITYDIATSEPIPSSPKKGYSERFIHSELYARYPSVNCVIHSHAEDVLPYVIGGVPMHAVYHMAGFLGTSVPVWDIDPLYQEGEQRDMLVNSARFGSGLASHFGPQDAEEPEHAVVLMRKHGFTTHAQSVETAVYRAIYTKINAKAQTDALATRANLKTLGGEVAIDDIKLTQEQVQGCTKMNEYFQEKPWRLWVKEVERMGIYVNRLA